MLIFTFLAHVFEVLFLEMFCVITPEGGLFGPNVGIVSGLFWIYFQCLNERVVQVVADNSESSMSLSEKAFILGFWS